MMHPKQAATMPEAPRSLRNPAERERRRQYLDLPHMQPLVRYVGDLRHESNIEVPDFDPFDGGTSAQILFLLEKPGPMTAAANSDVQTGSGFISRDNDDPTAEATFRFMQEAGLPRELTILWNVVPWWNGTRKVTNAELRLGVAQVGRLMGLLPHLKVVVLVGRKAQRAYTLLSHTCLPILRSDHPSPIVRARLPERWRNIPCEWAKAKPYLGPFSSQT
jgi:hypothetical protein